MSENALRCFDPAHRSYSTDRKWDVCQFRASVGDTVKDAFPAKVARGSAIDDAVMAMIAGDEPVNVEERLTRYLHEFHTPTYDLAKEVEAAVAQVALFERDVLPTLPAVHSTQLEVHWDVDGIPYHAHLDVVYADGSIDDLKSTDQRLGEHRADSDAQLTTYAYGLWAAFGNLAPRVGLIGLVNANPPKDVLAWNPTARKPWVDRQTSTRTPQQLASWADDARRREASRRFASSTGIYQTQGRSSLYECSSCPAKLLCPSWQGYELGGSVDVAA